MTGRLYPKGSSWHAWTAPPLIPVGGALYVSEAGAVCSCLCCSSAVCTDAAAVCSAKPSPALMTTMPPSDAALPVRADRHSVDRLRHRSCRLLLLVTASRSTSGCPCLQRCF